MKKVYNLIQYIGGILLCLAAGIAFAQTAPAHSAETLTHEVRTAEVTAQLLAWAPQGIAPGQPLWLGLHLKHAPGWHTYWKNPGQAGAATTLQWQLPAGSTAGDIIWPTPSKFAVANIVNYGYSSDTLLAVPVQVQKLPDSTTLDVELQAQWLACKVECLPQQGTLRLQLPIGQPITADAATFTHTQQNTPQDLPQAKLQATLSQDGQAVLFRATGLPADWQGKSLNAYPETAEIFTATAIENQKWQGAEWQLTLPLNPLRTQSPNTLPIVLALQDQTVSPANTQTPSANADQTTVYRLTAPTENIWPPAADQLQATATSPGLTDSSSSATEEHGNADAHIPAMAAPSLAEWLLGMGTALLGGIILNLMPCVFPVLAIKVLGFAQHAHSPQALRWSGITYSLGCIISCVALAAALLALRTGGQLLGWGFQLQNPYVIATLAALFTVIALNLLNVFTVGQWLPSAWQNADKNQNAATQAFFSGILAILISSPCSAPFVGAALSLALQLPAPLALAVFACMGLGVALPVLLASFFPRILQWLPKPGAWMEGLRQFMAFPMLATVVWLTWVLGQQSGIAGMAVLLALLILLAGFIWAWQHQGMVRRLGAAFFGLALLGFTALYGTQLANPAPAIAAASTQQAWQRWTPEREQEASKAGMPVFVDYTAAWCITCQFNKQTVLEQNDFLQWAQQHNVVLLRADWTRQDPTVTKSLHAQGRVAVPTYVFRMPSADGKLSSKVLEGVLSFEQIRRLVMKTE